MLYAYFGHWSRLTSWSLVKLMPRRSGNVNNFWNNVFYGILEFYDNADCSVDTFYTLLILDDRIFLKPLWD